MSHRTAVAWSLGFLVLGIWTLSLYDPLERASVFTWWAAVIALGCSTWFFVAAWWRWPRGVTHPRIPFVMYRAPFEPEPDRAPYDWATESQAAA